MSMKRSKEALSNLVDTVKSGTKQDPLLALFIVFLVPSITAALVLLALHGIVELLALVSLLVAILAVSITGQALAYTRQSLELTRATQRPFLNVSRIADRWKGIHGQAGTFSHLIVTINNTGNLPADEISILCNMSKDNEGEQKQTLVTAKKNPSLCFANQYMTDMYFWVSNAKEKLTVNYGEGFKVRITVEYRNKITQTSHKTIRSYLVRYTPTAEEEPMPLPEQDYWD